ncbi:hypothetical protein Tco_1054759 [Tanacetum coccineum]|uniref:Uncharacterized protein n=1 Tax=Tanacetum coccineum TaxID=301880 RepID=A0ABQ5GXP8_9ASTR
MFDESLSPSPNVDLQAPEVIAPIPEAVAPEHAMSTRSFSSTTVDQDAPSPSNSHTTQETQTPIISHDVEEDNHDIEVAHMGNDPYFVSKHNSKWTKDHPLENIIGALDRLVPHDSNPMTSHIRYYDAFLTSVEPKTYKEALTQACWIESYVKRNFINLNVWGSLGTLFSSPTEAFVISLNGSIRLSGSYFVHRKKATNLYPGTIYVDDINLAVLLLNSVDLFAKIVCSKFKDVDEALESLKKYAIICDPLDTPCKTTLGDRLVSWSSKRQKSAAISSTEAE